MYVYIYTHTHTQTHTHTHTQQNWQPAKGQNTADAFIAEMKAYDSDKDKQIKAAIEKNQVCVGLYVCMYVCVYMLNRTRRSRFLSRRRKVYMCARLNVSMYVC